MLKNKSYFAILFLFSSVCLNAANESKLIQPTRQQNQNNLPVVQQSNNQSNQIQHQESSKIGNSELIKELEVAIDKINKQDLERKKQYDEQMKEMNLEKERLNKEKVELEKERSIKGISTKEEVDKDKEKQEKERLLLQQKMQYNQMTEQYNSNSLEVYVEALKGRIKYFQEIKKSLVKDFVITSSYFDYIKVNNEIYAYVTTSALEDSVKKIDTVITNEEELNMKIKGLETSLSLKTINDLKQILSLYSPSSYKTEKTISNTINTQTVSYVKINEGQYINQKIYIKEINPNSIILSRE